ncbi:MAG: 4-hydroxythreonine-4-phosphate dehydrogenase PdxA, partial [Candidatus Lindowbacteria bacterium]|nr:4-hydroxythreonine-4-phosphate dehydrogenase PdxA [Candidatus Lindowbacteria bacterium]
DAAFTQRVRLNYDIIIAMYHDQGLAPFKALTCGAGVNVSLGAGIIRTSPDHGIAAEIAGTGAADLGSFQGARQLAARLVAKQQKS